MEAIQKNHVRAGSAIAMTQQATVDQAKAMILQNVLDARKSRFLKNALRAQAEDAQQSGCSEEALELRRLADELAVRFMSTD